MRIIDLLNKIANGEEVPKKIKFGDKIWKYDSSVQDYMNEDNNEYLFANIFGIETEKALNKEVEIIEEEKKIPEKICTNRIINTKDILEFEMIQNKINAEYTYAINEIIDFLKSKGDE